MEIQPAHPKGNQSWIFIGRTEAKNPILWPPDVENWLIGKDPDSGKDWRQEEKGMRGWDGWMASPTQWTLVWVNSGSWRWTGKPGVLQSMVSQRLRHDWATELNWTDWKKSESENHSVMSDSLWPHGLQSPWNSPGQNTGVDSLFLLQGIFPTQGSNPGLLHCTWILYQVSHKGSPWKLEWVAYPFSNGSSQPRNQIEVSCIAGRFFNNWAIRETHMLT